MPVVSMQLQDMSERVLSLGTHKRVQWRRERHTSPEQCICDQYVCAL